MQPGLRSRGVTGLLSAVLRAAMAGCPTLQTRDELAACATVLQSDRPLRVSDELCEVLVKIQYLISCRATLRPLHPHS